MAQYSPSEASGYYTSSGDTISEDDQQQRINYDPSGSITMGASFADGNRGEMFGTYIAPSLFVPLTEKLDLRFGAVIARYAMDDFEDWFTGNTFNGNYASNTFWLGADYYVNDKLMLGGTIAMEENNFLNRAQLDGERKAQNFSGTAHVSYKVNDNFRIFGAVTVRKGDGPFAPNPFVNGPGFNNFNGGPMFQNYYNPGNALSPFWGMGPW